MIFDADPGTREFDRLEVLTLLATDYENKHHPIDPPDPLEGIKFRMEQGGLTRKNLPFHTLSNSFLSLWDCGLTGARSALPALALQGSPRASADRE